MNIVSRLLILFVGAVVLTACIAAPVCAGALTVASDPSGAHYVITQNGSGTKYDGYANPSMTYDPLPSGAYHISMTHSNYPNAVVEVDVSVFDSGTTTYTGTFGTNPTTVPTSSSTTSLLIYTYLEGGNALPGVVIYLDNNAWSSGTTAGNPAVLPISGLSDGLHDILAVYDNNGRKQEQTFTVDTRTTSSLSITFQDTAGKLEITSTPEGASVYLDGSFVKRTPCTIEGVKPGDHTVRVELTDYQTLSTTVTVKENEIKQLSFPLTKMVGTGSVEIRCVPKTAKIYIDGMFCGYGDLTNGKFDAGMHKVLFEQEGYVSKLIDIEVKAREITRVNETLTEGVTENPLLGKTGITVTCTNVHASVFLDGNKIGVTPIENYLDVKNGEQQLTVKSAGYETYEETITLRPAEISSFVVSLKKWGEEEQPTETPTQEVTEVVTPFPTIPTLAPTALPTAATTETPASPMPIAGLLTGLAACVYLLRRR